MRTNVYIDGFNLYYGCVRGRPYHWLDLAKLCQVMLSKQNDINRIRYFTARVKSSPHDPQKAQRQDTYIRALKTIRILSVHEGTFLSQKTDMPLVQHAPGTPPLVEVWKTEEKGSDVNLATFMLLDAFDGDYEAAVVVSNDSDLLLPIMAVKLRFGLVVGVLNPHKYPSQELLREADFVRTIQERALKKSLFPEVLYDSVGEIRKPPAW